MKYRLPLLLYFLLLFVVINGCSNKVNNSVTFQNLSDGTILANFRGNAIEVSSGNSATVQEIPKGLYNYSTAILTVPSGTVTKTLQGATSGSMTIAAGTKILVVYSSTLASGSYILTASLSSSDDQSTVTGQ
ncbi:MAG: hypothetical protein P4L27_01385 [Ignavibacteriaceae bacterium]|nr:hypothetical protein [Ignavibacteriaceae bacterium]